jgi:hypothetical protein
MRLQKDCIHEAGVEAQEPQEAQPPFKNVIDFVALARDLAA